MKRHVLFVASASGLAGGERNLFDIAAALVRRSDWAVSVVVPEAGKLKEALEAAGCLVYVTALPKLILPASIIKIGRLIKRQKVDIVHAHGTRAAFYARPAARMAGVPCVYTVHGIHYLNHGFAVRWGHLVLERLMRRWTAKVVFVCRSDMQKGLAARVGGGADSVVIYNGVAPVSSTINDGSRVRQELGLNKDQPLILNVGRFHHQKGQIYLIEAAALIIKNRANAQFVFAGDGSTLEMVKAGTEKLGIEENVHFLGGRRDVDRLMAAADLFVLPSLWEGLPYVLLEAAQVGLPIVAAAVNGVPEVVIDGRTGLLTAPRDAEALASAILRLLDNNDFAHRLGKNAKELVNNKFKLNDMVDRMSALYREIVKTCVLV